MNNINNTQAPDFYEIYDYYTRPFYQTITGKILIGLCILVSLGILVYVIISRRKKKKQEPWEWATEQLLRIKLDSCKNKDDYKKFYFSLSSIIKKYLNKRFIWPTEDKTDDELIRLLEEKKFETISLDMIKKISEDALSVKFANEDALKTQAENDLKTTLQIITQTTPQPETKSKKKSKKT
jgi:hypothetical protein